MATLIKHYKKLLLLYQLEFINQRKCKYLCVKATPDCERVFLNTESNYLGSEVGLLTRLTD